MKRIAGYKKNNMVKIDAHQHFWKYNPTRDSWITEEMSVIQRDFLPGDLKPLLAENNIHGCVTVQSDQSEEENLFQLQHAQNFDFIKGVVGWVDLQAEDLEQKLKYFSTFKKLKGFRHVLQGEPERNFMLRPAFMKGIGLLKKYSFTYDLLIFPDQLKYALELVKAFPEQPFVIDHLAKPAIKSAEIKAWKEDMFAIAACKNVYCKVSGMVTEADWKTWTSKDLFPYLSVVTEAFGTDRIMFGSDWPVCLVAATYSKVLQIIEEFYSDFTIAEQAKIWGTNAIKFYNLEV